MVLSVPSLSECNVYKLCTDNKAQFFCRLIRSYNITVGHQLLGLVCTVDSSTFHGLIHQKF